MIFCCCCCLIFSCCCCCWCCHTKFLIKSSLTPLGRRKLFSRCRLPFFRMFVYVLLIFDWLKNFSLENPPRKLRILNFCFLSSFSTRFFKRHDCACSVLKSNGVFCSRGNFNRMENDLKGTLMQIWKSANNLFKINMLKISH